MASLEDLHADLIVSSLAFLQIKDIASINVNSMLHAISNSNPLWEQLCASLWATKHSQFHLTPARRESLLAADAEGAAETSWKQRCEHSLKDGKRTALTGPKELSSLVFDFRFRAKPEFSVSRNFCFDSGSGRVVGHPNGLTYQWTVNRSGRVVTLGLFPPAHVRRLKNWGWALVNPNIVLVSTFSHGAAAGIAGGEKEEESDSSSSSSGRELGTSVNAGDSGDNGGASGLSTSAAVTATDSALVRQHPELFEGRSREPSGAVRALMDMHPIEGFVLPAAPPRQRPAGVNGGLRIDRGVGGQHQPPSPPAAPVPFSGLGVYPRGEGAGGFGVPLGPGRGSNERGDSDDDDDDDDGPTEAGDVGATGRLWLDFVSSGLLKPPSKQHGCQPRGALSLAGCHDRGKGSDAQPSNPTPGQQGQPPGSNAVAPATRAVLPLWRLMQAERRRRGLVVGVKPLPYPGLH
mmetsp:Transcript_17041/g.34654  ORF Transcript_17041/g.34654 Transcript_17041/m.34654 type:complete len:462 (-) Transcript_17041:153-1538(-)